MCDDNLLLHRARIDRGLDLSDVAARTSLNPAIVEAIDRGCLEALPPGIYARSYVRAFASAVGLQPEEVLLQLEGGLPQVGDPLPALREKARGALPDFAEALDDWRHRKIVRLKALSECALAWADGRSRRLTTGGGAFDLGRSVRSIGPLRLPRFPHRMVRTTLRRRPLREQPGPPGLPGRRGVAACLDAAVLLLLLAAIVRLTAWTSGAPMREMLALAGESIAALWGVLVVLYFVLLGGVAGRTPGATICRLPPAAAREPLRLRSILERAMLH